MKRPNTSVVFYGIHIDITRANMTQIQDLPLGKWFLQRKIFIEIVE